ncbi:MAG: hypothetical protein IJH55_08315, partial [Romboutsia sp.]|nr:hypothetical protein [Romboutsia sp.]
MIRYQEMVPDYYIEASRDFQVLCRMYDFAMNSLKYNIDSMQNLTDTRNVKDTVLPLLGDKLGIYDKEAFANRQMLEALPIALKYKGSLKSVNILLNAFLDSMDVFDNALALHSKDEESAAEISEILNRPIGTYSIVIILSTFPSLTNLHVLNTYLDMVIPTGLVVEYAFGLNREYFERFKYKEYTFLFYTHRHTYSTEGITAPYISMVKGKDDRYSAIFNYVGTDNISSRKEFVGDTQGTVSYTLKHDAVPIPPATNVLVYQINKNKETGVETEIALTYSSSGTYSITIPADCMTYIKYNYNK